MELDARYIHEKQFHDAWRGYNQEEVDDFLDRVAEVLDRVQRENRSLQQRVADLEEQLAQGRNTEEMLKKTLVTAQRAAEEAIETARNKAEQLIAEAEERARRKAEEAAKRNDQTEREHAARKRDLDASIARLKKHEADLKAKLKSFLEEQLRAVSRLDGAPPPARQATPERGSMLTERPGAPLRATPSRLPATDDPRARRELEDDPVGEFSWRPGSS